MKPSRGWPVQPSEDASGPLVINSGRRIGQSGAFQLVFCARLTMDRFELCQPLFASHNTSAAVYDPHRAGLPRSRVAH